MAKKGSATSEPKPRFLFSILRDKCISRFKNLYFLIAYHGVTNEPDELKQKYIILLNLDAVIVCFVTFFSGFFLFFVGEIIAGLMFICGGGLWLMPFYFNRNGLTIISRLWVVFHTNAMLLIASCWFSHNSHLDAFFLISAINCIFIYMYTERYWQFLSIFLSLGLYVVECTSLQEYLPAYNRLKEIQPTDIIVLFAQICMVSLHVGAYVYVNHLREKSLLEKQAVLLKMQNKMQVQNDDLAAFSIAASHSMQTPLYVSDYFLKKIKETDFPGMGGMKNNIEMIENSLQQMEQCISGLFSYNRIINIENERTYFDIDKELLLVKKTIKPRYPAANIIIPQSDQIILTNQLLFSIIMHNLIDNGLKYNTSVIPEVKVEMIKKVSTIELLVADNGIGIPEKNFTTIFEPFKRIQIDMKSTKGNGLGLAGAKRAAERIGGKLRCFKSSPSGTIFKLEIPIG